MVLWLGMFTSSLISAQPNDANQADKDKIIAAVVDMWNAIETGDAERYAAYIHPDYTGFGESDVYLREGRQLELESIQEFITRAKGVHTDMHQPKVVIRGNTAWITYYWSDYGYISDERYTSRGKSTRIFAKEGGKWLCIHAHFTEVP